MIKSSIKPPLSGARGYKKLKTSLPNIGVIIEGRTIVLEPISRDQINDRYVSWLNDPQINEFLDIRYKKQSLPDIIDYVNTLRSKKGCELFGIFTKRKHTHVGNVALTNYNPRNQGYATYGLMIGDPKAQMLGMGAEASVFIVEYLFRDPNIRRIHESTIAQNYRSCQMLEGLGFHKEGVLRQHAVLRSGRISDVYIYGMLREEWQTKRIKMSYLLKNMKILDYKKDALPSTWRASSI